MRKNDANEYVLQGSQGCAHKNYSPVYFTSRNLGSGGMWGSVRPPPPIIENFLYVFRFSCEVLLKIPLYTPQS